MLCTTHKCWRVLPAFGITLGILAGELTTGARASQVYDAPNWGRLQATFHRAAAEFRVPEAILLAVSYNETLWEDHDGRPSTSGGYGPMHLTHVDTLTAANPKGDGMARSVRRDAALHTLDAAARLLHVPVRRLEREPAENIRGGAALLAAYAHRLLHRLPATLSGWYAPVAAYSASSDFTIARQFASAVFATIRSGAQRVTSDGQLVRLTPSRPDLTGRQGLGLLDLQQTTGRKAECPIILICHFSAD
ncbi:MAG: N-acetylmuramoyl-L-alanine amidase, partial [Chloroflexota bacterium]